MTVLDWLTTSMRKLKDAGVDSPRRDSLVLLEDVLYKDRSWVVTHPEFELLEEEINKLDELLKRRVKREPLAYIRGKAWFYKRFFEVDPSVLIPRPESESFITLLKNIRPKYIDDIGTGSGALAITAALEIPDAHVYAIDNDFRALRVARENAKCLGARVGFVHSDMLRSTLAHAQEHQAIIANLPYVPEGQKIEPEINFEPATSVFSGKDGLNHYRKFWQQVKDLNPQPKYILNESLKNQHKDLARLAGNAGYKLKKTDVLVQQFEKV